MTWLSDASITQDQSSKIIGRIGKEKPDSRKPSGRRPHIRALFIEDSDDPQRIDIPPGCRDACKWQCKQACKQECMAACKHECQEACKHQCQESCKHSCQESCKHSCQEMCQHTCTTADKVACRQRRE